MLNSLGPLPQLKAFTLTGPAHFTVQPVVLVQIQDTKDTLGGDWNGLAARFGKWSRDNKVHAVRYVSSGGGALEAYFSPEDAERIRAWLVEQGGQEEPAV
jgi:hypothetical protein